MLFKSILLAASALLAGALTFPPIVPISSLGEYEDLYNRCRNDPNAYVGVHYQDGYETLYHFDECYPYSLPVHGIAEVAVFCRTSTCNSNPNPDCTGGAVPPVPIPVPAPIILVNAADFVQLLGQGATCQRNGLSGL